MEETKKEESVEKSVDVNGITAEVKAESKAETPTKKEDEEEISSSDDEDVSDVSDSEDKSDEAAADDDDDVVVAHEESSLGFMPCRPGLVSNVVRKSPVRKAHPNLDEWKAKKEAEKEERKKAKRQEKKKKRKAERKARKAAAAASEGETAPVAVNGTTKPAPAEENATQEPVPVPPKEGKKSAGSLLCFCCGTTDNDIDPKSWKKPRYFEENIYEKFICALMYHLQFLLHLLTTSVAVSYSMQIQLPWKMPFVARSTAI